MEGAVVKQAISFHATSTMTPDAAQLLVRQRVKAGVQKRGALHPYVVRAPVRLDVTFKNYTPAEMLTYLPIVQRTSSHGIRFDGRDILQVSRFLEFINTYNADMTP
jgi:D-amino peptidase